MCLRAPGHVDFVTRLQVEGGGQRQQLLAGWIEQLQAGGARAANMLQVNEALAQNPDWLQIFVDAGLRIEHDEPLTYADRHVIGRGRVLIRH